MSLCSTIKLNAASLVIAEVTLSPSTTSRLTKAMEYSLTKHTQQNYASAVTQSMEFCTMENIDPSLRFPADEFILCAFVSSISSTKSGSTAANAIAGLKAWHNLHGKQWSGRYLLSHVLHGADNLTPPSSRHTPRLPVTINMLETLAFDLDPDLSFDVVV